MKKCSNKKIGLLLLYVAIVALCGCKKFLDEKTEASLAVPQTLKDLQALLDPAHLINEVDPSADEVSAGEFYVTDADFANRSETDRRLYTWQNDNVLPAQVNDWYYRYSIIYRCNTVLEIIDHITQNSSNIADWRDIKGQAHFHRAKAYLQAVNIWAKVYDVKSASTDIGIPIRANINFNETSKRASVQQNYDLIILDLENAIDLLPDNPVHVVRPSKLAALGMLSRVYLWMGKYEEAFRYADLCLKMKGDLIDFNTLTATATYPLSQFNTEVLFASRISGLPIIALSRAKIIAELYNSYEVNDLRKTVYFRDNLNGSYGFKGSYDGSSLYFSGVATNEVYLNRAECYARMGQIGEALTDLNNLLRKRYKTGMFTDYNLIDKEEVLQLILRERRKELVFRGLRWADIKRLNREGSNISLTRNIGGKDYFLPANSARFAIPLPDDLVVLSGIPQNQY